MQIPKRKQGVFSNIPIDRNITQIKFNKMQTELLNLKTKLPNAIKEVERLGAFGDFSENAEYQLAKGKLRGMNNRVTELEEFLKRAVIINSNPDISKIRIGHKVTLEFENKQVLYTILGSEETDPSKGIISHRSILGKELLGKKINDFIQIKTQTGIKIYKIIKIE